LDVKIGVLVMWCCILFISAIVFFPPVVVSGRVLRYLYSGGREGRGVRGRRGGREEAEDVMIRGTISLTEWPSLRQLRGRDAQDSAASFLPTVTVDATTSTTSSISTATPTGPLRVFQVAPPVQGPGGSIIQSDGSDNSTALSSSGNTCRVTLMVHVFKDSFGAPFVGNYTPPSCMGSANAVVMNFEVQSQGTQFDRLGIM
jgi:hypothetical protein